MVTKNMQQQSTMKGAKTLAKLGAKIIKTTAKSVSKTPTELGKMAGKYSVKVLKKTSMKDKIMSSVKKTMGYK